MTEEILLTRTTLTQLFTLSGYPTVTVLPPPDAGSFSSLSSVRICNKQRRRRYSRLIQTILWTKVTLGKAFWKALNKKANRDLKGQFGKLERPTRSLKLFCLWFLDNVKVPIYKSLELVSFKKRSLNKKKQRRSVRSVFTCSSKGSIHGANIFTFTLSLWAAAYLRHLMNCLALRKSGSDQKCRHSSCSQHCFRWVLQ